ncbi:MAG: S9 family peptidase [Alphaproteobacteria bacterium]|nr:S9 family peptidase [Alphaproteobacteria bacterium]
MVLLKHVVCCILLVIFCSISDAINLDNSNPSKILKTQLIPREILLAKPDRFCVKVSPNGKYVSYFSRIGSEVELHITTIDGKLVRKFPVISSRNMGTYCWSFSNKYILLPEDNQGDENDHILCLNIKTGAKKNLTPFQKSKSFIYAISQNFPNEIIVGNNMRDAKWFDAYRINIETGVCKTLFENNFYLSLIFNSKFQIKAFVRTLKNGDIELLTPKNERILTIPFEEATCGCFYHMKKDEDILYASYPMGKDKASLIAIDLQTKKVTTLFESDLADVRLGSCDPKTCEPQIATVNYLRKQNIPLSSSILKNLSILRKKLGNKEFYIKDRSIDDSLWIVFTEESNESVKYYSFKKANNDLKFLFSNQAALDRYNFQKMEPVVIKSRDGLNLVCYLTRATNSEILKNPTPLIAYIHGGPWARDDYSFDKIVQLFANRGYAVLQINYRGSEGFGKKFLNSINKNLEGVRNDIIDAINWAIDQKIADKNKIAIMGASFGGYSTLAGLTFTPDFFCCGVDIVGPSNFITLLSSVPEYWKPHMVTWYKTAGNPDNPDDIPYLKEISPLFHKDRIKKPLLVFQGANDPRVAKAESDQIVSALKQKKHSVAYVLYPDEGHGFHREPNIKSSIAFTEKFLAKILGGWYEPIKEEELKESTHKIIEGKNIF